MKNIYFTCLVVLLCSDIVFSSKNNCNSISKSIQKCLNSEDLLPLVKYIIDNNCDVPSSTKGDILKIIHSDLNSPKLTILFAASQTVLLLSSANIAHIYDFDFAKTISTMEELMEDDGMFRCCVESTNHGNAFNTGMAWWVLGMIFKNATPMENFIAPFMNKLIDSVPIVMEQVQSTGSAFYFNDAADKSALEITSQFIVGLKMLAASVDSKLHIIDEHILGFASFFDNQASSSHHTAAIDALSDNDILVPVKIDFINGHVLNPSSSRVVSVRVVNFAGTPVKSEVVIKTIKSGENALAHDIKMIADQESIFSVDLFDAVPTLKTGFLTLFFSATLTPSLSDSHKYRKNVGFMQVVRVAATIETLDVNIDLPDQKLHLSYPKSAKNIVEVGKEDRIVVKITLHKLDFQPHQVFLVFSCDDCPNDIHFVPTSDGSVFTSIFESGSSLFSYPFPKSGRYSLSLLVGDVLIKEPISWKLMEFDFSFPDKNVDFSKPSKTLPEIFHTFSQTEKRPNQFISWIFTFLAFLLFVALIFALFKVGAFSIRFPVFNFYAVGFQLSLASIVGLIVAYWWSIYFFTMLKGLIIASICAIFFGHKELKRLAAIKTKTE